MAKDDLIEKSVGRLLLAAVLFSFLGCSYNPKNADYSSLATVTPHFSSINPMIIQTQCMPCHQPGGDSHDFSTYAGVLTQVKPGNATSSNLYKVLESGEMPVDRPMLTDDQILAVYQWIQNGAPND